METARVVVTLGGLLVSGFVAGFFWFSPRPEARIEAVGGVQEVKVTVKGGYSPDVIVVKTGKPVRFNFTRRESAVCSETVILDDFGKSAILPEGQTVPIEFAPDQPGEYDFYCQMNMLRGKIVVE